MEWSEVGSALPGEVPTSGLHPTSDGLQWDLLHTPRTGGQKVLVSESHTHYQISQLLRR